MWRDPAPSQHVVILPQRITTFLSRCVKDTWVKDHIARWVSIAFGGRSPAHPARNLQRRHRTQDRD
jgi:hypothetical protein